MITGEKGRKIDCPSCGGSGLSLSQQTYWNGPNECNTCQGNGKVWEYPSGKLALYYGGPFVG